MQFRNDIQGLRALAFLVVFIFHLNLNWLPGGFLGVDLFFVISGFLITTITLSDIDKGKFSFINFFKKRFKRLLPAYYVLLLICSLLGMYVYLYTDLNSFIKSIKYATLFISNHIFSNGDSYFGAKLSENPFLHTWSLSIEMQFYVILPFLIFCFKKYLKYIFILLILVLTIYSTYLIEFEDRKALMYFSLLARIPEFLIGCLYSVVFHKGLDFGKTKNNLIAILSLATFLVCIFLITEETNFPGYLALIPCIAMANLLVLKANIISQLLSNKVLVKIGEYSYSLYLWHWPVMAFLRYRNDAYEFTTPQVYVVILLTVILSWLSYKLIENSSRRFSDKNFFIIYGIFTVLLGLIAFNFKQISKDKKIPILYSKPYFGIESHGTNVIQKFGDLTKNDSILLIGDSHANMLKPFFDKIGRKNDFSFKSLTSYSFLAIDGIMKDEVSTEDINFYNESRKYVAITSELIKNNKIIIVNGVSYNRVNSYKVALDNLVKSLRPSQKLILVNTFPLIKVNLFKMNGGWVKKSDSNIEYVYNYKSERILQNLVNKYDNVYLYDLTKSKIFNTPGYINDTIAYYDKYHINTFASLKLAEDLEYDFMQFLNEIRSK